MTMAVTAALGVWQVERRAWKLSLIAAVDACIHAAPVSAPGPAAWASLTERDDAYRRVRVTGRFDHARETLVQAVTGRGEGYWLMAPLQTPFGWTVLVNRGFVAAGDAQIDRPPGMVTVTGLLRMSEPGGAFLRANRSGENRWYSRDVAGIAAARRLGRVAPYFIDAGAAPGTGYPVGGLTVVRFRNAHLSYAITWFTLSALSAWGLWFTLRQR